MKQDFTIHLIVCLTIYCNKHSFHCFLTFCLHAVWGLLMINWWGKSSIANHNQNWNMCWFPLSLQYCTFGSFIYSASVRLWPNNGYLEVLYMISKSYVKSYIKSYARSFTHCFKLGLVAICHMGLVFGFWFLEVLGICLSV